MFRNTLGISKPPPAYGEAALMDGAYSNGQKGIAGDRTPARWWQKENTGTLASAPQRLVNTQNARNYIPWAGCSPVLLRTARSSTGWLLSQRIVEVPVRGGERSHSNYKASHRR